MKDNLKTLENMKNQTIGVEVEMNNITRENAAKVAAGVFGTNSYRYTGGSHEDGYMTWSAFDAQGRKWKFSRDVSISGPEAEKCELVTPILRYEDITLLQEVIRALRKAGAKSNYRRGCGVHIHIGADGHNAKTLRNLTNIMASHESLLVNSLKINKQRIGRYCRPVDKKFLEQVNEKKPATMEELKNVWYGSQHCTYGMTQHYNESRYHMLNLHATFTKGTIEFRLFQFDPAYKTKKNNLHAGKLKAYIQLCLALSQRAKDVKYAKPEEPVANLENPKYVMRFWLKTMGMIGDEFKTAREVLLENLDGNSDCRWANRSECTHRTMVEAEAA